MIIAIAGGSGSGKTTFARNIAAKLENGLETHDIAVIGMDRYYLDKPDNLTEEEKMRINFDNPKELDWELFRNDIQELVKGNGINLPIYSYEPPKRMGYEPFEPKRLIIFEGIWMLLDEGIREMCDLKVYVDVDADVRLARRIERDVEERGRRVEDTIYRYLSQVKPMHERYVEPTKKYADIVVMHGGDNKKAVDVVASWIKAHIGQIQN